MKKITLLLLLLLVSFSGFAQFTPAVEGFEATTGPDALPSTNWTLGTGGWAVFDNGTGLAQRWGINAALPYQGANSAYINRENIGAGNTSEDYLASPSVLVPTNGKLHFFTRSFTSGNQGTIYRVMVASSASVRTNPLSYIPVQEWTEATLNTTFNVYEEKIVDLSAYAGTNVYIAFVMVWNQTGTALGDRWLVDNVSLTEQCDAPTLAAAGSITQTTATLSWTGTATQYEVEIIPQAGAFTGTGTVVNANSFNATQTTAGAALLPNTAYSFKVRAVCTGGNNSAWTAAVNFTTSSPGISCGAPITVTTLPYVTTDNTANYTDSTDVPQPTACAGGTTNYMAGNDVFYSYTATANGTISVTMTPTVGNANSSVFVYNGCANVGVACVGGVADTGSGVRALPNIPVVAGQTYIIVISSSGLTQTVGYNLAIQPVACAQPAGLGAINITQSSADLSWAAGAATSWEIVWQLAGGPIPTAAGTQTNNNTAYPLTGLTANTQYEYYVRADCNDGSGNFSAYAGPYTFTTLIAPLGCGGNYVDSGGAAANYTSNEDITTTVCPDTVGDVVTVTFTAFDTESTWDGLYVFDGNTIAAPQIASANPAGNVPGGVTGSYWGLTIPGPFTSSSADGCLTFRFRSDPSVVHAGWVANVTCAPPPPCRKPTAIAASTVLSDSAVISWIQPVNPDTTVATSWEVLVLPCGSPAPDATATGVQTFDNPLTLTGLTQVTCYDVYVRALCGNPDNSVWGGPVTFTTQVTPPVCGGVFVDPAGAAAPYANTSDSTVTICPDVPGDVVTVTFTSFDIQATFDGLYVFNGNSIASPQIASANGAGFVPGGLAGAYWGTSAPLPFTSSSVDGCLTFRFRSDGFTNGAGWVANVTCGLPPTCSIPTAVTVDPFSVNSNSATISWTQPANPDNSVATQWEVLALPCGSPNPDATAVPTFTTSTNPFTLTGLTSATCYTVYVRAVCSATDNSQWGGIATFTTQVAPPVCGGNFVDDAGIAANYVNSSDSTVTICPDTVGDLVTVTFTSFFTEATWDGLLVYDGNSILAPQIASANPGGNGPIAAFPGSYWGNLTGANIPGPFTSSSVDGCLTFRFISDTSVNDPGWVANVTCGPPPTCRRPIVLTNSTVTATSAAISWTQPVNPDGSTATAWQVLLLPCGSLPPAANATGYIDVTTNPYTLTGLTSNTCYSVYVRAVCSATDSSTWSSATTFTTSFACGGTYTDGPGATADYTVNSNSVSTICPDTPGDVVTVTFSSFVTQANSDGLYVYDGNSITAPQLSSTNPAGFAPSTAPGAYWGTLTGGNLPGPFTSSAANGCLTFKFLSDGFGTAAGWVANITCGPPPLCPKPNTLTANPITSTSAYLGWTEMNQQVSSWQVYNVLQGQPAPLPDTTTGWVTVTTNPALFTGLTSGTQYTYYVRSICPDGSYSLWSTPFNYSTLIINDDCSGALFAPVNSSAECGQITAGTITGATASAVPLDAPCIGTPNDDVWFQFIATNPYLNVSLQNIVGTTTGLNFAAYSGDCGTLTQIFCSAVNLTAGVLNNLTVGQTYYLRVYSNGTAAETVNFNLCISTPSTCPTASTVCSLTDYANTTGVTSLGTIGCLFTSPNPAYFTIQVDTTGPINYTLTQSNQPSVNGVPGPANIDVDYAAWGPFANQDEACTFIGSAQPYAAPGIGVPVTQQTGCSYSAAPTETLNIANAIAGQYYIILITNFSNQAGYITLTQNNVATDPNHGTTNCCPNATFGYNPVTYCKEAGAPNPVPTIYSGSLAGNFTASPAGLVFANSATGEIDLAASAPGNYIVTNTLVATATCTEKTATTTIQIVEPVTASFGYDLPSYCNVLYTTPQPATLTGATGGSFGASPNGGLYIDVVTGAITPSLSSPGIYTVTYYLPGTGSCILSNPSTTVEIIGAPHPAFTQVPPICPGDPLAALPTTSNDGFTGTWSPAMNNTITTTYTFTPTAGQCATTSTMTIGVGSTTPTFTQVAPICPGGTFTLPTTSNAPELVTGTWSPAIDNTQTTTYTFTASSGVCVAPVTMTVVVDTPTIVPTFNAVPPICPNGTLAALPTTSTNNITGSWAPALDPTQTTTYTFTPDTAQCALPTTLTIIVNPESQVTVNSSAICPGSSTTVTATPAIAGSYSYAWSVPQGAADPGDVASFTTSTPGTYTVVITPISSFCNSDFETPVATGTTPNLVNDSAVPCWNTTSADGIIEIWPPGFEGVTPYSGNNLVELNANTPGTLYQDFSVIPGTSISVSFAHRGRQGVDVVGVEVGPVGGPYTSLGNFSDGNTAWALHTVNYTIPTGAGTNYTLRFVSVSSTGGNPSIGNLLDAISISSLGCASQPASGVVTVQNLPDPTVTVTQPTCTVPTGTIVVTSPLNGTGSGTPSNLFISEVTDAAAGSLTYVELYNGTGAAIDLANYKLKVYNYGSTPGNPVNLSCDLPLTGMIAANTTKVIKVSSSAEIPGITPDLVFAGCGGVNNNDYIKLTTSADVDVDLWGMTDGSSYTPGGAAGYTYRRLNTATLPSTTWNAADWTALDPEDYTNIGTYAMSAGTYEYSLDGGTYQPGTTFAGVAPGPHTITVHDLVTGCYSIAFSVTVDAVVGQVPSVTGFHYDTASVCILSSTNPVVVPDAGFTAGGTYTATPSGLTLDPTTGAVTTATSQVGTYTVTYSILFDPVTCQSAGSSTSTVEIVATTPAVVGISYSAASYCKIEVPNTVTPTMATGYTVGGTYSATPTGLSIDATTGVITLATSAPNTYVVSYTVASSAANCIAANTGTFTVTVTAPTLAGVGIIDYGTATTYCKIAVPNTVSPGMVTGYTVGGTYSATPSGLSIDATTGIVTLGTSTPNTYTITYSVNDIPGSCIAANSGTFTLTVTAPTLPVVGFDYTTPICSSDTTLTPSFATGFVSGGTFSSSILAVDAITGVVTITQGTPAGSYDVLYSVAQNTVTCELANTDTATIVVNAPISIGVIGDCQNNDFVLTVSPVTGTFDPAATYAWSNGSAPLGSTATQTVSAAGTYTVTVTLNGCVSTASIIVSKEDIACMIQKGISADGDGLNDNFDLTAFNVKKITIFNRYGMEVYSKTDYTNQWKGEDKNGDELPDGTYYYVFNRDNGETRTGWIYINRRN